MEGPQKPKFYNAEAIGAPGIPESLRSPERFKASMSFDFVFGLKDGKRHPYCIEFNGDDSGIGGAQKVPDLDPTIRIMAGIRDHRDIYGMTKNRKAVGILNDIASGDFSVSAINKKPLVDFLLNEYKRKIKLLPNAITNEKWLQTIANNKAIQGHFIPEANRPRELTREDEQHISSTGYWVVKPTYGLAGRGIKVFTNEEIDQVITENPKIWTEYVIQEYIESTGAAAAGENKADRAASLRLLIDFRYLENDEVDIVYSFAYQRVGKEPINVTSDGASRETSTIINLTTGAEAHKATKEETDAALAVAKDIIKNLADFQELVSY